MGTITYDNWTGRLATGAIWLLDYAFVKLRTDTSDIIWAEPGEGGSSQDIKECPIDPRHVTEIVDLQVKLELFGSGTVADFVPVSQDIIPVISPRFAERLRRTDLTGFVIEDIVTISLNQSQLRNPRLLYLKITGRGGRPQARRLEVSGASNLCPHCGKVPMVCPSCGQTNWPTCVECGQWTLRIPKRPEYSHPKGFLLQGYPPDVHIVEGKHWDGSDFFMADGVSYVSNRAKEWMEKTHTFPVEFKPALLNIEGVEEKFKDLLPPGKKP